MADNKETWPVVGPVVFWPQGELGRIAVGLSDFPKGAFCGNGGCGGPEEE